MEVRYIVTGFINSNWEYFKQFVEGEDRNFVLKMSMQGENANEIVIRATALAMGRRVAVYDSRLGDVPREYPSPEDLFADRIDNDLAPLIFFRDQTGFGEDYSGHFRAVVPRDATDDSVASTR